MNKLNLNNIGVKELDSIEVINIDGGYRQGGPAFMMKHGEEILTKIMDGLDYADAFIESAFFPHFWN